MHISATDYQILALKSSTFITKELVTSANRTNEESFALFVFILVNSILQLEAMLLLLLLELFKFIDKIKGCEFAISLPEKNTKKYLTEIH